MKGTKGLYLHLVGLGLDLNSEQQKEAVEITRKILSLAPKSTAAFLVGLVNALEVLEAVYISTLGEKEEEVVIELRKDGEVLGELKKEKDIQDTIKKLFQIVKVKEGFSREEKNRCEVYENGRFSPFLTFIFRTEVSVNHLLDDFMNLVRKDFSEGALQDYQSEQVFYFMRLLHESFKRIFSIKQQLYLGGLVANLVVENIINQMSKEDFDKFLRFVKEKYEVV